LDRSGWTDRSGWERNRLCADVNADAEHRCSVDHTSGCSRVWCALGAWGLVLHVHVHLHGMCACVCVCALVRVCVAAWLAGWPGGRVAGWLGRDPVRRSIAGQADSPSLIGPDSFSKYPKYPDAPCSIADTMMIQAAADSVTFLRDLMDRNQTCADCLMKCHGANTPFRICADRCAVCLPLHKP
jgi:hypothetical protein